MSDDASPRYKKPVHILDKGRSTSGTRDQVGKFDKEAFWMSRHFFRMIKIVANAE